MSKWTDYFSSFFRDHERDIATLAYAYGCREGWIQGQMFLHTTDDAFATNWYKLPNSRQKADFYGERPFRTSNKRRMVAELKVIGASYMTKDIDGNSNIDQYATGGRVDITEQHMRGINYGTGSLLKDVARLRTVQDKDIDKYMLLVIPAVTDGSEDTKLGSVLRNISISRKEWNWKYNGFDVRVWQI